MQHAVFYIDAGCQEAEQGGDAAGKVGWHVERVGTTSEQCVGLGREGGRWASVEFMRGDEWGIWERRRRGVDDGVGWGWRGVF